MAAQLCIAGCLSSRVHKLSSVDNVWSFFPPSNTVPLDSAMPKRMSVRPCEVMVSEPAGSDKRYWSHRIMPLYKNHEEQPDQLKTRNLLQCPSFALRSNVKRYKLCQTLGKLPFAVSKWIETLQ